MLALRSARCRLAMLSILATAPVCALGRPGAETLAPAQAQALVSRALGDELRTAGDHGRPMRYRLRRQSPRLTTTKEIVETAHEGNVARLVAINDRPLDAAGEQKEEERLDALERDPKLQQHRKRGEDNDTGIVLKLLRMMPQAFLYQYEGPGQSPAGPVQKFSFRPNPHFSPPDLETQALTAMTGEVWVDVARERVARLSGSLQQDTSYGWGILGKLNKGGWLQIEQGEVAGHDWRITRVQLKMTLRILVKTKVFDTDQQMTGYQPVPPGIDYRAAIRLLRGR